ncbi:MAG TPA: hypothetical protein VMT78_01365, partial [Terriglobia bacterium]|nr:hypothetical protein [Terriglobia bacterium]
LPPAATARAENIERLRYFRFLLHHTVRRPRRSCDQRSSDPRAGLARSYETTVRGLSLNTSKDRVRYLKLLAKVD